MYTIALVSLLAAASPGPDFFIVMRNSLVYSRKAGMMTAVGIAMALIIHLAYTLIGIGILITESPFLYSLLTKAGALYLLYIGCRGIFSKSTAANTTYSQSRDTLSPKNAFFQGFLTNVLNPKCALFYISLFSQFISPTTPLEIKIGYGLLNWCIVLCWFLLLSWIITSKKIQEHLLRFRTAIDRIMGSALVYLGIKLLFI